MVEVPDSTTRYIQSDSGKPTKDLFNWMRNISQQISDILSGTGGGLFSSGLPGFRVIKNAAQTGLANASFNTVTWQTEIYDIGSHFGSNGWTPPAGRVHLNFGIWASGSVTTGSNHTSRIMKNGVELVRTAAPTFGGTDGLSTLAVDDVANGTDVYTVNAYMDGVAGTWQVNISGSWFSGHWISP